MAEDLADKIYDHLKSSRVRVVAQNGTTLEEEGFTKRYVITKGTVKLVHNRFNRIFRVFCYFACIDSLSSTAHVELCDGTRLCDICVQDKEEAFNSRYMDDVEETVSTILCSSLQSTC